MSYAMTHFLIAQRFMKNKDIHIKEPDYFYMGSYSPDTVHYREDFVLDMKARSHNLQPGKQWGGFLTEEDMSNWYNRLREFYNEKKILVTNDKELSFLQGYTHHILVDIFNSQLLYGKSLIRYDFQVDRLRAIYRDECIMQDNYFYQKDPNSQKIMESIGRAVADETIDTMLSNLELDSSISAKNIRDNYLFFRESYEKAKPASLEGLDIVSEEKSEEFLQVVTEQTLRMLYDFPEVERTFRME